MGTPATPLKPAPAAASQQKRVLKKGEHLFSEGDSSRAMFLLKSGAIRIYKKKGESHIEIDTVRAGQIIGELAFLDGNPRSASGEALMDCELIEISGPAFQNTLGTMPDWLKIMLKTVVTRLRGASTRIRQLESASTAFDYSSKDGKMASHYVYLSPPDVLKILTGILLVAARNGKEQREGIDIRLTLLQRYANQVMGVPMAKVTTMVDLLSEAGVMGMSEDPSSPQVYLKDIRFLEQTIGYLNDENMAEPNKRHDISPRGFFVMSTIAKYLEKYPKDEATGCSTINLAEIRKLETAALGKDPFRLDETEELIKLGYCGQLSLVSADQALSLVKPDHFSQSCRIQRIVLMVHAVNEQKRKGGK